MKPYRPLLGPFVQVLPPGQRAPTAPKAKKSAPKPTRPAKRTPYGTSGMLLAMCPKGHALTTRNSYVSTSGKRVCSLCNLL